jgi:hypothetical protein
MLWSKFEAMEPSDERLLSVARILARYDPENQMWSGNLGKVCEAITLTDLRRLEYWLTELSPLRAELVEPLTAIASDGKRPERQRSMARRALTFYNASP